MIFSFQILSFILATLLCIRHRREQSSFLHMTARCSFDPCAGRSCVWGMILNALPRGVGRFRMCSAALCTYSAERLFLFRVCRGLRAAPNAIFTRGVVTVNCICSAAFCESAALRGSGLALSVIACGDATSPKGRGKSTAGSFLVSPNTSATGFKPWLSLWESWRGSV